MKHILRRVAALGALPVLAITLFAAVRIGGSSFSANGQLAPNYQYTGSCPVELKFDWGVVGTQPATVTYSTVRSDGAQSAPASIQHPGGNRSVPIIVQLAPGRKLTAIPELPRVG